MLKQRFPPYNSHLKYFINTNNMLILEHVLGLIPSDFVSINQFHIFFQNELEKLLSCAHMPGNMKERNFPPSFWE